MQFHLIITGERSASIMCTSLQLSWRPATKLLVSMTTKYTMSGTYTAVSCEGWLSGSAMYELSYCDGPKIIRSLQTLKCACETLQEFQGQLDCCKQHSSIFGGI